MSGLGATKGPRHRQTTAEMSGLETANDSLLPRRVPEETRPAIEDKGLKGRLASLLRYFQKARRGHGALKFFSRWLETCPSFSPTLGTTPPPLPQLLVFCSHLHDAYWSVKPSSSPRLSFTFIAFLGQQSIFVRLTFRMKSFLVCLFFSDNILFAIFRWRPSGARSNLEVWSKGQRVVQRPLRD